MSSERDRVADAYEGRFMPGEFSRRLRDRVHWMCRQVQGRRVLDVGCSQGIVSILLGRERFQVVGIDIDPTLIDEAREALAKESDSVSANVRFIAGDILDEELDLGRFDTIILGQLLEHVVRPDRVIERCRELLESDGVLVITVPRGYHPDPGHKTTFHVSSLVDLLAPHFRIEKLDAIHIRLCAVARPLHGPDTRDADEIWRWLEFSDAVSLAAEERAWLQINTLKQRWEGRKKETEAGSSELEAAQALEQTLRAARKRAEQSEAEAVRLKEERAALREIERKLWNAAISRDRAIRYSRRRLGMMQDATSYRLGLMIVRSLQRPYLLVALPFQAVALLGKAAISRVIRRREKPEPRLADLPSPLDPIPGWFSATPVGASAPAPPSAPGAIAPVKGKRAVSRGPRPRKALPPPPAVDISDGPVRRPDLHVAVILDEFSRMCFQYECSLIEITPDNWRSRLSEQRPAFLFVESAWRGNEDAWRYMLTTSSGKPRQAVVDLVGWCKQHGIPTVFWNKEDPPNFELFIETARLFDYVFTTDANCIPRYKEILGHDQIRALPFAAQPRIHNPINVKGGRIYDVGFAGAWYGGGKHPERAEQAEYILDPALQHGLHVYDRNYGVTETDRYRFPDKYKRHIVGGLDYRDMLAAYKQYRIFLNVNSVPDSPTMFSRRVFELLTSGTMVVSAYAKGISSLLGDGLVSMSHNAEETQQILEMLLRSPELRDRIALQAQRKIFSEHTYGHRLEQILDTLRIPYEKEQNLVTCMVATNRPDQTENVFANYRRQVYEPKELVIVLNNNGISAEAVREEANRAEIHNVRVYQVDESRPLGECLNLGIEEARGAYWAKMDDDNFHAPNFLTDLMHAFLYTDAGIVGKTSYYAYMADPQLMTIRTPGYEHRYINWTSGSAMIVRREILDTIRFPVQPGSGEDTKFLRDCMSAGVRLYSTDRFNYVCVRHSDLEQHTWKVADDEYMAKCEVQYYGSSFDHVIV